jgi:hypothetical protein
MANTFTCIHHRMPSKILGAGQETAKREKVPGLQSGRLVSSSAGVTTFEPSGRNLQNVTKQKKVIQHSINISNFEQLGK